MGDLGFMGTKIRYNGEMVEAVKIFIGANLGADPKLADLLHKGVPISELVDVLEPLLLEQFGAKVRE
jgi:ferredoxin-nitrite reductase